MCVYEITEAEVLKKDLLAYKVVCYPLIEGEETIYFSRFEPTEREFQFLPENAKEFYPIPQGKTISYKIGEKVSSSFKDTPGLYCYISINAALFAEIFLPKGCTILVVTIPKGTQIKRAKSAKFALGNDVILAEEVIPINVFLQNCNGKLELAL